MAGYDWSRGKSNNAVSAEDDGGLMPLSKIKKVDIDSLGIDIALSEAKLLAWHGYWMPREWHHTSKFFNETDYYDLEDLKEIIEEEDYKSYLKEIKEKKEDIFYAEIEVKEFYKHGRRIIVDTERLLAEIKDYNRVGDYCKFNDKRKKKTNIKIVRTMSKEEYEKERKERELAEKKEKKKFELEKLRKMKKEIINKYKNYHNEEICVIIEKIKNSRTAHKIKLLVEQLEKKLIDICVDKKNLMGWAMLPEEAKHPAPQYIMIAKKNSGLSWGEFEEKILKGEVYA